MFRYEKLGDFCFSCGKLDHLERNCDFMFPGGLRYYGPWLRAYKLNPTSFEEATRDLNRLNSRKLQAPVEHDPITPALNAVLPADQVAPYCSKSKASGRDVSLVYMKGLSSNSNTPMNDEKGKGIALTPPPGFSKPKWSAYSPKLNSADCSHDVQGPLSGVYGMSDNPSGLKAISTSYPEEMQQKDINDLPFLNNYFFSPTISTISSNYLDNFNKVAHLPLEEAFIPYEQLRYMVEKSTGGGPGLTNSGVLTNTIPILEMTKNRSLADGSVETTVAKDSRKRGPTLLKASSEPTKKAKKDFIVDLAIDDGTKNAKAETGVSQSCQLQ